jgi:hypothetical protein
VAARPDLKARIAAVYMIDTVVPAGDGPDAGGPALPACRTRGQTRCVLAWQAVTDGAALSAKRVLDRAMVWTPTGELVHLGGRAALCVNPLTGGAATPSAPLRANLGAANATGLEWGVRPPFLPHQVSARCEGGLLHVSHPGSPSLQPSGSWTERRKAAPFNLFYADIEADAHARVQTLLGGHDGPPAPAITSRITVTSNPIHRID